MLTNDNIMKKIFIITFIILLLGVATLSIAETDNNIINWLRHEVNNIIEKMDVQDNDIQQLKEENTQLNEDIIELQNDIELLKNKPASSGLKVIDANGVYVGHIITIVGYSSQVFNINLQKMFNYDFATGIPTIDGISSGYYFTSTDCTGEKYIQEESVSPFKYYFDEHSNIYYHITPKNYNIGTIIYNSHFQYSEIQCVVMDSVESYKINKITSLLEEVEAPPSFEGPLSIVVN
jgi:hypothetical protein